MAAYRAPVAPRSAEQRRVDALAKLAAQDADCWVASADPEGQAHLVPLSFAWDGHHVVLAVQPDSRTATNVIGAGRARLGLGHTRDVVMIDVVVVRTVLCEDADDLAALFAGQCDWDPRTASTPYLFVVLRPERVQAWREADEIAGRTIMRGGDWLD